MSSCATETAKPWDTSAFDQTSFTFVDTDKAEQVIAGDIKIDGIPTLDNIQSYVIYWGNSGSTTGKTNLLKEISSTPSDGILHSIPVGTPMDGSHFLLYIKTLDKENYSGKSISINDVFEVAKQEKAPEKPQEPDSTPEPSLVAPTAPSVSVPDKGPELNTKEEVVKSQVAVVIVKNVLFDFDKYEMQEEYKQQLLDQLDSLTNKDQVKLLIAGHADERGSNAYNLALGERRAYVVKRFLVSMGFLESNMKVVSYGEEKPADTGHNESAWAKNRRTETVDLRE